MERGFERIILLLDRVLNGIIFLISAAVLLVSGYSIYDNFRIHKEASDSSILIYKPPADAINNSVLKWLNGQSAWLTIDGTNIDYPVMQGKDNFEYLNKDPYGEFRLSGSIFLDSGNSEDFSDEYSLIYGHHMDHNSMFGSLDFFSSESYFNSHRTGQLTVKDAQYRLELFAVVQGDAGDRVVFQPQGRTSVEVAAYIEDHALINTGYEAGRRIVGLSTCAGEKYSSRLIVFGMLKEN